MFCYLVLYFFQFGNYFCKTHGLSENIDENSAGGSMYVFSLRMYVILMFICTQIELDDKAVKTASGECVLRDYFVVILLQFFSLGKLWQFSDFPCSSD